MGAGAADTAAERESLRTVPLTRCVTPHLRHSYSNPTNKKWHAGGTGMPLYIPGCIILVFLYPDMQPGI